MEALIRIAQWKVGARSAISSTAMAEPQSLTEQEWLGEIAKGNQAAFRSLYERYQGRLYRFALHMSGNAATAEEVTQEVFMVIMRRAGAYRAERGTVAGFLFGIARNLTRCSLRESRLHNGDSHLDNNGALEVEGSRWEEPVVAADPLEELSQAEVLAGLRKAVLALPEPYREAVVLCDLEEMSYQEAAALLECPAGTVASRLHRARAILRTKLSKPACVR